MKPRITKLGTIDCDMAETTPVVFKGRLWRFEYVRNGLGYPYWNNKTGDSYFRFIDHESGRAGKSFARGYHLGNVIMDGDTLFVTGTNHWGGERVDIFASRDMERWDSWNALNLPGYGIFNTSVCRANDRYVMMFEVSKPPEIAGVYYTARFATSHDMKQWELTPPECTYSKDRYTAPHCLRYLDGYYYNFYLEALPTGTLPDGLGGEPTGWETYVVRSMDLVHWESSPLNPVLRASDEDRQIANLSLTPEQRERVREAENTNNSDIDFCEYQGHLVINYSWGDQHGVEHVAEARFDGTLAEFLTGWFPTEEAERFG